MEMLHEGHNGISKTVATAKLRYFWPGIRTDISTMVNKCEACQTTRASLPNDRLIHTTAEYPMERIAVDLFEFQNIHYLLMVDRYSGYPWIERLNNLSSEKIVEILKRWFLQFGFPRAIRSDGGPQFRARFKQFCNEYGIRHELASPYNSQSNGLAEVNVRLAKGLLAKVGRKDFDEAFASWRNSERNNRPSPNVLFFGRRVRSKLPEISHTFPIGDPIHNTSEDKLRPLKVTDLVWMQNQTGSWPHKGEIVSIDKRGRTYKIILEDGRSFIRNRKFIRKRFS